MSVTLALGISWGQSTVKSLTVEEMDARRAAAAERQAEAKAEIEAREKAQAEAEAEKKQEEIAQAAARGLAGTPRPTFRLTGQEAWAAATQQGWKFCPRGCAGACDGRHSVAQMHPGINTSLIEGPRMSQYRTAPGWAVLSQNTFYMFASPDGRARPLREGWAVKDLTVHGQNWRWITQPKRGGRSPYFAIEITGLRGDAESSQVELKELILEGPPGATDWRIAFTRMQTDPPAPSAQQP
jgi:hypothetical protein